MTLYNKNMFPELKSEPNWTVTWIIRIVFIFVFGTIVLGVICIPYLLYLDRTISQSEFVFFALPYYPILLLAGYLCYRYLRKLRRTSILHIRVNDQGLYMDTLEGGVKEVLYTNLEPSKDHNLYDVYTQSRMIFINDQTHHQEFIMVTYEGFPKKLEVFSPDIGYSYLAKNSGQLRAHFIQGIQLFRPDLKIDPAIFSTFYIDPKTFVYHRKTKHRDIIITIVISLVILLIVFFILEL